jgi:hypothetical protein
LEKTHAYNQEMMGPDMIIAGTILLDRGEIFKPATKIYGKAKMPCLRLKSKSLVPRERDSEP